jgi:hypothetical protein
MSMRHGGFEVMSYRMEEGGPCIGSDSAVNEMRSRNEVTYRS